MALPPKVTQLPSAPTRAQPNNFVARADTFLSALPGFGNQLNGLADWLYAQTGSGADVATLAKNYARDTGVLPLANVAGSADAVTADLSPALGDIQLSVLSTVEFIPAATNTGPMTLNVDGVGAWPVQRRNGSAVVAGDIGAGRSYLLRRRGAQWRAVGLLDSDVQEKVSALANETYGIGLTSGVMRLPTVGGTADAITAEPAAQSANVVISNNSLLMLTPALTTTASDPTLTTRGVTRTIRDADGGALRAGDLRSGFTYILRVRSATEVWIVSGGVNQRDLLRLVAAVPRQGTAAAPVVQGVPEVGRTLAADYGTPESSAEIDWQVHDTGVGTQGWAVFASGAKVTLAAAQLGKFIRFRYRIGTAGAWVVSAVVGPVAELTDQTLIEVALLRQTVARLESAVAALQSQTPGAPAMIAAPLDLYRQSAASPGIGWLGNVTAPLPSTAATMLTTYTPPENVIHPCMVELPQPLLGFKYISAITAYPNGPALEDPFVYGSNDRMNWTFLGSTPQPLDVKPSTTGAYNSDTFITHDPATGELIVGYRAYAPRDNTSSVGENSDVIIYIRRTKDGNTWTPREEIFRIQASVNIILSPTVIYDPVGGLWHMWTIYRPNMHHWTAPSISGPWTQDTATVSISDFNVPHHHEVKWVGNRLACLMYSRGDGNLYFGVFADGSWTDITWSKIGVLSPRPVSLYKASFLPVWSADNESVAFDVWWTTGAAGPAGGIDTNLGRALQYARTNSVAVSATPKLVPPPAGSITAPVIAGNPVSGSILSVDTGGTSLDGYNFNWQWNTGGGTVTTAVGTSSGVPYAPLALDDAWIGRYIRCRYRMGASSVWTLTGFVGPVTAVAPSPEP